MTITEETVTTAMSGVTGIGMMTGAATDMVKAMAMAVVATTTEHLRLRTRCSSLALATGR